MKYIGGTQEVINNLMLKRSKLLRRCAEVVESTAVDVANDAKRDHIPGQAHQMDRYANRTSTLTRSISSRLTKVGFDLVEAEVFTNIEYAAHVEAIYPYLWPATVANQEKLRRRLKAIGWSD